MVLKNINFSWLKKSLYKNKTLLLVGITVIPIALVSITAMLAQKPTRDFPKAEDTDRCSIDVDVIEDTPTPSPQIPTQGIRPTGMITIAPTTAPILTLSSPACNNLALSITDNQQIKAEFNFSGQNSPEIKLVAGVFYRMYSLQNAPDANWIALGDLYSGNGNSNNITLTRYFNDPQSGVTYEFAGSINAFIDVNGDGVWSKDSTEPRDVCSGKVSSSTWENNDCPTKNNCLKSIIAP